MFITLLLLNLGIYRANAAAFAGVGHALEVHTAATCEATLTYEPRPFFPKTLNLTELHHALTTVPGVRLVSGDLRTVEGLTIYASVGEDENYDRWTGEPLVRLRLVRTAGEAGDRGDHYDVIAAYLNLVVHEALRETLDVNVHEREALGDAGIVQHQAEVHYRIDGAVLYVSSLVIHPKLMPAPDFARLVHALLTCEARIKRRIGL